MLVTKNAAELCALLVNDIYGELPSRIIIALLTKGRSTIQQLTKHTSLPSRHLRNGLGVLLQQNLLYAQTDSATKITTYDANADACYNLVRSGKILEDLEQRFGAAERDLVQTLLMLGHARIHDLAQAFAARGPQVKGGTNGAEHAASGLIGSESQFRSILARLIQADIVEAVRADTFRSPVEVHLEIKQDVTKSSPAEKVSTRDKAAHEKEIADRFISFRDNSKAIKRELDRARPSFAKRRKLLNGHAAMEDASEDEAPHLNPNIIVRVNYERCLVELRNQRLAAFAADTLGEATADVYRIVLDLVTASMPRCRPDPLVGHIEPQPDPVVITTLDIFDHLGENVQVSTGIGKAPKGTVDHSSAERVNPNVPQSDDESDFDDSDDDGPTNGRPASVRPGRALNNHDDDDPFSESEGENGVNGDAQGTQTNGERQPRVKFETSSSNRADRLDQMRQHLLLLKDSKHRFIRHCGVQGRGQWTIDFSQLMDRLREAEMDAVVEHSFGRHGLRLTRIMREKGKLDEKLLQSLAMMKKGDVQGKMLAMKMAGLVDIQEVPRDANRLANRTLFFWHFDAEKTQAQLLDDVYKAMLRCLETLQVKRHHERYILSFVERKDVVGKEEEVMTEEHYNTYNGHLEIQEKLMGQVMRLDDMISVLRDF